MSSLGKNGRRGLNRSLGIERLESRRLLATIQQTQLFLQRLNEARHDPAAYQVREAIPLNMSGIAPRPPLALNESLVASSQSHADEMATFDYFGHRSVVTGRYPNRNAVDNGYSLPSHWDLDANFIEAIAGGPATAEGSLRQLTLSVGHRNHLYAIVPFYADNREAGIGYAENPSARYRHYWTVHMAHSEPTESFLNGVVFDDANANGRYDLGEGLGGVLVEADGRSVITNEAGGWALPVANDTSVVVQASHPDWAQAATTSLTVGGENVQLDFRYDTASDQVWSRQQFGIWLDAAIFPGGPRPGPAWQNPVDRADVNGDGEVQPLDALLILNRLARARRLGIPVAELLDESPRYYWDVDGNGRIEPLDALLVLNRLARSNRWQSSLEGEAVDWLLTDRPDLSLGFAGHDSQRDELIGDNGFRRPADRARGRIV